MSGASYSAMHVGGEHRQAFTTGLCDEKPVERVAMVQREAGDREAVVGCQAKDAQAVSQDVGLEIVGDNELAGRRLDTDLGERHDAEQQLAGTFDRLLRLGTDGRRALQVPQHNVRIEQQPHAGSSSSSSISSSVSSKSSPIAICRASDP